jgi:NAD(P)-dependent dehydrogenase (short-subunit alcohol dehydrogenase family)
MPLNQPIPSLSGRTVWVVGGSTGIGKALADAALLQGARLVVSGRQSQSLAEAFPSDRVRREVIDITELGAAQRVMDALAADGWLPDLVFWVAGDYKPQPIAEFRVEDARRVLETNLLACYDGLRALLNHWLPAAPARAASAAQPRFHICWFSSVAGYRGLPLALSYSASKAGLNAMAETCFVELKPKGIDVSLVCPGFVKTRLTDGNDFKMPALISIEEAAQQTLRGLAKGEFEIHYPRRFTWFMKFLRILPHRLFFSMARRSLPPPKEQAK